MPPPPPRDVFIGQTVYGFKIENEQIEPDGTVTVWFQDDRGTNWSLTAPDGITGYWSILEFEDEHGKYHKVGPGTDYPDKEPMAHIAQAQEKPPDPISITEDEVRDTLDEPGEFGRVVLGQPTSIAKPPADPMYTLPPPPDQVIDQLQRDQPTRIANPDPPVATPVLGRARTPEEIEAKQQAEAEEVARRDHALNPDLAKQRAEELARYEEAQNPDLAKQRAEELERYEQAQKGSQNPQPATGVPQPDGDGDGIANEYGDGPDLDGNGVPDEIGINPDNQQPGYPGGEGLPDGNANGIPGEYGDGPDLDGNGIPDEVGINPDSLRAGYPNPSAPVDWGGVEVPDPTVVPPSDTSAEAMPEEYGEGSGVDANWVPEEETGIDPYASEQPAYPDPSSSSTSGDEAWDPYSGSSSEPYVPPEEAPLEEEAPVTEEEDPSTLGTF